MAKAKGLSPRVRGNQNYVSLADLKIGSIPACAGEPHPGAHARGALGVYPACAGEPGFLRLTRALGRVYPRVCGGTINRGINGLIHHGLSPRVRGNLGATSGRRRGSGVYPRVCGGTRRPGRPAGRREGLSPRVRGNPGPVRVAHDVERSIPACAGEPPYSVAVCQLTGVYPRVCGGTRAAAGSLTWTLGLSPRVRGTR